MTQSPLPRRDCFFGLHFDLHPGLNDTSLGTDTSIDNVRQLLERVHPDFVQYDCKGHAGYTGYPTTVGWPSPGIQQDSLAIWRAVTHEKGIGLYIHYSGVWDMVAIEHQPEWACVNADGKPDKNATSTFGAYVDELMIPQLKEVTAAYELDGVWVDGECWATRWDYSPAALAAWKNVSGSDYAPTPGDPQWLAWKQFQRDQFESYLVHWIDALHQFNPNLQLTSNWMYTLHAPLPVKAKVDFLSGDYSPTLSVDRARIEARYLASTGMPWDLMAWGFDTPPGLTQTLKTPLHLQQEASVVLMQGGGFQIYYQPTRSGYICEDIINTTGEVADFCRVRQAVSHKSSSVPQVALLYSTATHMERSDNVFIPFAIEQLQGALQALLENHYSVDILSEHQLQPRLNEFSLVVIANASVLPDEFRAALINYVNDGGRLLLMEEAVRLFETELGVSFDGDTEATIAEVKTSSGMVNLNGDWQKVLLRDAQAFAYRYPTLDSRKDGEIAATIHTLGRGHTGAIYGSAALAFFNSHHPYLRELIGDLAKVLFPDPSIIVDGPPTLDVALRRTAQGQLCIHLLNTANVPHSDRYGHTDFIPPIGPIHLKVKVTQRPQKVWFEPDHTELKWTWHEEWLSITLDKLHVHAVVVVE
ncbi:MAG: alpha-amylase family protein [Abditibacteriaceae bacterium]